ncbi:MAG: hypothetical protein ACYTGL_16670 [Planctomycetota bacterium]|jgi:hypothetical protein
MNRREFLRSSGPVSAASLVVANGLHAAESAVSSHQPGTSPLTTGSWFDPARTWHFFDLWHVDHLTNLKLRQGQAEWQSDATFVDPPIGNLSAWPTVYRDDATGRWRMLYSAAWKPYQLMAAESDDGRSWHPFAQPQIKPAGEKVAPHHIFTLPGGSGGGVYLDPVAADDFPFKVYVHTQGTPAYERAIADPNHRWHELAKRVGDKRYINEEFTLVSRDGLHWEPRFDLAWSLPDWHPEPPIFGFYNRFLDRHSMTVRPGWGDRRQCLQSSSNFTDWSGPQLLLQPDFNDEELVEFYGMPVFPYGDGYVGLLWVFHCESSEPTRGFNRFTGPLDCQLAFSHDGIRFERGSRTPLIEVGPPGTAIGGAIEPSCLVETDDEIRIYSSSSKVHHGQSRDARRRGVTDVASITLHTLRKDGLTYLETAGDHGRFISKPMVFTSDELSINASAPHGELRFQLTDMESHPIEGYTFDDSAPLRAGDSMNFPIRWKTASLADVTEKIVRLEVQMRHARLFAIRGQFHFIDAQDRSLIQDGQTIVT